MAQDILYVLGFIPGKGDDFYDFLITDTVEKAEAHKEKYTKNIFDFLPGEEKSFFENREWVVRHVPTEGYVAGNALTYETDGTKVIKLKRAMPKKTVLFIDQFYPEGLLNGC